MKLIKNHGVVDIFTDTWNQMGFNFKFTDLLASFGLVQLKNAEVRIRHLKEIYHLFREGIQHLPFIKLVPVDIARGEFPIYAEVLCPQRTELMEYLKQRDIQTRPVPPNISISNYLDNEGDFPNSEVFSSQGLYLPSGPAQSFENVQRVIEALREFKY
jgi:dTDP-4-amino-4,6-dideoxygalactose transaminase